MRLFLCGVQMQFEYASACAKREKPRRQRRRSLHPDERFAVGFAFTTMPTTKALLMFAATLGLLPACRNRHAEEGARREARQEELLPHATNRGLAPAHAGAADVDASRVASGSDGDARMADRCSGVPCRRFATARDAFEFVLEEQPRVLGIGEAHAQKGGGLEATASWFARELLPALEGRASDLLLEAMMPPRGCAVATTAAKTAQREVTERQTETAQSDYIALGEAARARGIVPDLLRPSCADVAAMGDAGADLVAVSMRTIARLSHAQAKRLLARPIEGEKSIVVLYGGAFHNDLTPDAEREAWSYGPELAAETAETNGRYVALDLFARQAVLTSASYRRFSWFLAAENAASEEGVLLLRPEPRSYVLLAPLPPAATAKAPASPVGRATDAGR